MTKENLIISQNTALVDKRRRLGKTSKIVQVVLDTEIPPELTIPPKIIQLPDWRTHATGKHKIYKRWGYADRVKQI